MNNTSRNIIQNIVKKVPSTLYFTITPDRQQALKYLNWLYDNVPESKSVDQEQLFREVICFELRIVNMKIIETNILLMVALNSITLEDFTIDTKTLVTKLIAENQDKYDLDIMYRILAQIMTKLPRDLQARLNGKQKLEIFQIIAGFIKMDPKLIENFISFDPTLNTPVTMDLDSGDYNTLNKKYLKDLQIYKDSQQYVDRNSMEFATIATKMIETTPTNTAIKTQYIDQNPDLMLGVNDDNLYYYDSSSGALTEIPINGNQQPVSEADLQTILTSDKVDKDQIAMLLNGLHPPPTATTAAAKPSNFFDSLSFGSLFSRFTGSSTPVTASSTPIPTQAAVSLQPPTIPIPPQYMAAQNPQNLQLQQDPYQQYILKSTSLQQEEYDEYLRKLKTIPTVKPINLINARLMEAEYQARQNTYESFMSSIKDEQLFIDHLKNKQNKQNKNIENVAISLVTVIILILLLVIFRSVTQKETK